MLNFLAPAEELAAAINPTMQLIMLDMFKEHVRYCPHPMCGRCINIDGNCKVRREICGEPLPHPGDVIGRDPGEKDVHNAFANGFLRKKTCDRTPARGFRGLCVTCSAAAEPQVVPESIAQVSVVSEEPAKKRTRSDTVSDQPAPQPDTLIVDSHQEPQPTASDIPQSDCPESSTQVGPIFMLHCTGNCLTIGCFIVLILNKILLECI